MCEYFFPSARVNILPTLHDDQSGAPLQGAVEGLLAWHGKYGIT